MLPAKDQNTKMVEAVALMQTVLKNVPDAPENGDTFGYSTHVAKSVREALVDKIPLEILPDFIVVAKGFGYASGRTFKERLFFDYVFSETIDRIVNNGGPDRVAMLSMIRSHLNLDGRDAVVFAEAAEQVKREAEGGKP